MCIIAIKTKGIELPSEDTLEHMWFRNPDGAGLMYNRNGKVYIEKGFMHYDSFLNRLKTLDQKYNLKESSVILHFRITTHGGTKPENTHPFPVTDSIGMLKKLMCKTSLGVAHNGIIDIKPRKGISDTMEYVASQLGPLYKGAPDFYHNKNLMTMVSNAIDSKMAFMNGKGEIFTIGKFVEDNGMKYSNYSYQPYSFRNTTLSMYGSDGWEMYDSEPLYACRLLMWLDDQKDEFVVDHDGNMLIGNFAIDFQGKVYEWEDDCGAMVQRSSFRAYTADFKAVQYDAESELVFEEVVMIP